MAALADLAYLACPVGMGGMMWMMMRPSKDRAPRGDSEVDERAELERLRQEVEELKTAQRDGI